MSSHISSALRRYGKRDLRPTERGHKKTGIIDRLMLHEKILKTQLNADIIPYNRKTMTQYDRIIFLAPFHSKKLRKLARLKRTYPTKKVYIWWIGTDVWNAIKKKNNYDINDIKDVRAVHLCVSDTLKKELSAIGITAETLTLVPDISKYDIKPLPEKYTVAIYMPSTHLNFYNFTMTKNIIQATKGLGINYIIYGNRKKSPIAHYDNVDDRGWVKDVNKIISDSSCLLRLTKHDGFPKSIIEYVLSGREVITNHGYPIITVKKKKDQIIKALRKKPRLSNEAVKFYRLHYSPRIIKSWFDAH